MQGLPLTPHRRQHERSLTPIPYLEGAPPMRLDVFMRLLTFLEPHVNDTFVSHAANYLYATTQPITVLLRVHNSKCVIK